MTAQNVFSRYVTRRGHDAEFGKKRYLFRIVYGGEHFCRVSELCDLNSLQDCKLKRNLKVAQILTLVARGGPVAQQSPDQKWPDKIKLDMLTILAARVSEL